MQKNACPNCGMRGIWYMNFLLSLVMMLKDGGLFYRNKVLRVKRIRTTLPACLEKWRWFKWTFVTLEPLKEVLRNAKTEPTGFEPAVFCVTGRHVRPLHHGSICARCAISTAYTVDNIRLVLICQALSQALSSTFSFLLINRLWGDIRLSHPKGSDCFPQTFELIFDPLTFLIKRVSH